MLKKFLKPIHGYWLSYQQQKYSHHLHPTNTSIPEQQGSRTFEVKRAEELRRAILHAQPHDIILITKSGNYGEIHIRDKTHLILRASHRELHIEGYLSIEGHSHHIEIDNLHLWHRRGNAEKYLVSLGTYTQAICIQNCIFTSYPNMQAANHPKEQVCRWINGLAIDGKDHIIRHNQIKHVQQAIHLMGFKCEISHNFIQFFSRDAIHVQQSHSDISHNSILDPVTSTANTAKSITAILLTSRYHDIQRRPLTHINISSNIIKNQSFKFLQQASFQPLLGIVATAGLFKQLAIQGNRILAYGNKGIALSNTPDALVTDNILHVDQTLQNTEAGIYFDYTNECENKSFDTELTIKHGNNQASYLKIAEGYRSFDLGNNHYQMTSDAMH